MTQAVQTLDHHYYLTKLLGYGYNIVYRSDKENMVADALSRLQQLPQFFSRHYHF